MKKHILIVEDNQAEQLFMTKIMETHYPHIDYELVNNIEKGWNAIINNKYRNIIVLLDLNFKGQSGFLLLKKIKQHQYLCNIPVVVYTHSSNPSDIQYAYELGANSYVTKPLGLKQTTDTIQKIIDYWHDVNLMET